MSRDARGGRVFTAAEELACYFDTADEPCNIHLEVCLPDRLDEAALRAAAVAALAGNERTAARRARHRRLSRRYQWEQPGRLDTDPVAVASFADAGELARLREQFLATAPPVGLAPPVRLLLASGPGGDHLILNAHHAVMDGLSFLELLRDMSRRYQKAAGLPAPPATPGRPAPPARSAIPAPPAAAVRPAAAADGRLARPARIAGEPGAGTGTGCGLHLAPLAELPAVRPFADGGKPTLGEALTAALITAVGRWNTEHGQPDRAVRVTTPVNDRPSGAPFTLGNGSRLAAVSARPAPSGADPEPLLRTVAAQARMLRRAARQPQIGRASRLLAGRWLPVSLKRLAVRLLLATAAPLVVDTVMLTNLGNVPDLPDFGVPGRVTMALSGPAQMPRGLSVGVISASGTLQIGVRYNRALLDDPAAARFTALLLDALAETTITRQLVVTTPHC